MITLQAFSLGQPQWRMPSADNHCRRHKNQLQLERVTVQYTDTQKKSLSVQKY